MTGFAGHHTAPDAQAIEVSAVLQKPIEFSDVIALASAAPDTS